MNSPKINRRNWIKAGTLLAGGMAFGSFPTNARPKANRIMSTYRREFGEIDIPILKARLLANENPFGPSPKAKEVLKNCIDKSFMYPYFELMQFKEIIAEKEGVKPENVMLAAGSTEILMAAAAAYTKDKTSILTADITYDDLLWYSEDFGAEIDRVPLTKELDFDLDAMQNKASTDHSLAYLVNPNNPTGKSIDAVKLKSFCNAVSNKVPVFIDEAYIDFKEDVDANSMFSCVREGKNVIVARTFSKLHAFAGLRFGYAIALPETIKSLEIFSTQGRSISYPTIHAAMASYTDTEFLEYSKEEILKSRKFLYDTLEDAGYTYIDSDANFVMFELKYMKAKRFAEEMFKQQVGIRDWSFRNKEWCRVSMGTMEEMKFFAKAFEKLS